jgi:hypothetical protein
MHTTALTLKRSFSPGFVGTFCEQLHSPGLEAMRGLLRLSLRTRCKKHKARRPSLDEQIVRSSVHAVLSMDAVANHFAAFGEARLMLRQRALPLIISMLSSILPLTETATLVQFIH